MYIENIHTSSSFLIRAEGAVGMVETLNFKPAGFEALDHKIRSLQNNMA